MRHKGQPKPPPTVKTLGAAAEKRILDGEPWLRVWSQQLAVPLVTISKKTGIHMARLLLYEAGELAPTQDEMAAIAKALGTTVEEINAV